MTEAVLPREQEIQNQKEGVLPEEKIYDLLSSVGNAENKGLVLIIMQDGGIKSMKDLYNGMMSHQEKNKRWNFGYPNTFQLCERSISPIGLVTREALNTDGREWGYQITEFGLQVIPFVGAILKWSYEHPKYSLYKMFSSTQSSTIKDEQSLGKKRAQERRYRLYWEVATNPSQRIRATDIATNMKERESTISRHLEILDKNGVLVYQNPEKGKSFSYFRLKEGIASDKPAPFNKYSKLSPRIYDFLSHEFSSVEEIVNHIVEKYPEYRDLNRSHFGSAIADILSDFEKQGIVERKKFSFDFQSELTVSDEQKEAIVSLLTIIDKFKKWDKQTIEDGRKFAQRVITEKDIFSKLMLKTKEASPSANATSRKVMQSWLISILRQYPNRTVEQVLSILEKDYDKKLTHAGVLRNLSILVRDGKGISEATKFGNVYRLVEENNPAVPSKIKT